MGPEAFFEACRKVGLPETSARAQWKKARDAHFKSNDPYLIVFILEGLLAQSALIHAKSAKLFQEVHQGQSDAVAKEVARVIGPILSDAASTATSAALYSPARVLWKAIVFLVLATLVGSTAFLAGSKETRERTDTWAYIASEPEAVVWAEFIKLNPDLPASFEKCKSGDGLQQAANGSGCHIPVWATRAGYDGLSGNTLQDHRWMFNMMVGGSLVLAMMVLVAGIKKARPWFIRAAVA